MTSKRLLDLCRIEAASNPKFAMDLHEMLNDLDVSVAQARYNERHGV